jgi:hypothetical protein
VFGKHLLEITSLLEGGVEFIIADGSLFASTVYGKTYLNEEFRQSVVKIFNQFDNVSYLVKRTLPYVPHGRGQKEERAKEIDKKIRAALEEFNIPYQLIDVKSGIEKIIADLGLGV